MNLLCWIPQEHDATSFYRALQPISQLRKMVPNLNIFHVPKEINMIHLAHMDAVFLQRPSSVGHLELIQICKNLRIKVWVEYDDNLFCVPTSNPAQLLLDKNTKKIIADIMDGADIISVSTEQLKQDLSKIIPSKKLIRVIPNAFNDYLFKDEPVYQPNNIIFWRGTQSHQADLHQFSDEIIRVAKKNPQWLFNFMGYNPFFITEKLPNQSIHTQGQELFKYHEVIKRIHPNLALVTLTDTEFNRCKSNIAWIEATYAGAVTLGPTMPEWIKPGLLNYHSIEHFGALLNELICEKAIPAGKKLHALSWEYIQDNLRLSKVNEQREALLEELMSL
jgi:hypothetical protein